MSDRLERLCLSATGPTKRISTRERAGLVSPLRMRSRHTVWFECFKRVLVVTPRKESQVRSLHPYLMNASVP